MVIRRRSSRGISASLVAFIIMMSGTTLTGSPDRQPVTSTSIASIGYDPQRRMLDVEFQSGATYRYLKVPPDAASRFMEAESKGRFFSRHIRGKFAFHRLRP